MIFQHTKNILILSAVFCLGVMSITAAYYLGSSHRAPAINLSDLAAPAKKDIAMQLVSSAENSSLDWKAQYGYIEDIGDGRGYTGGLIGFTSKTGDMLEVVEYYSQLAPEAPLLNYLPALRAARNTDTHTGLDQGFMEAWKAAATDPLFRQAQDEKRDEIYFNPAVQQAQTDKLNALGQFIYYDAIVMHGPGDDPTSFDSIRAAAMRQAKTPAQGGNETAYLNAFLSERKIAMNQEAAHRDINRIDAEQQKFLQAGNLDLTLPLSWRVNDDDYTIRD